MKRFQLGLIILFSVIYASVAGTQDVSAQFDKPKSTVDLSGVDWTGLARMFYGKCGEWHELAMAVGWTKEQWPKLSYVIHRESRCRIEAYNGTDPNGGSRGLMQINGYWCKKNRWNPHGWLQAQGILETCDDLYKPEVNLRAGLAMWNYSQQYNGCGWRPWATSCR